MCLLCDADRGGEGVARRTHLLRLLALVEHPDALPAAAALRIAGEILALTRAEREPRRCDAVPGPVADVANDQP